MILRTITSFCTILGLSGTSALCADGDTSDEILATYVDGEVTQAELEAVSAMLPASALPRLKSEKIQAIAIMEYLDETADTDVSDPALQTRIKWAQAKPLVPLFTHKLKESCEITEEELEKRFRENHENFVKPERRRIRNIFRRVDPSADSEVEATRSEMNSIRQKLIDGADFEKIAQKESESKTSFDGGLVGNVIRGQMPIELEKVIFSLEKDEISPVVEYNDGYHIFLCEGITAQRAPSEEEIRTRIRNFYRQKTFRTKWEELQDKWVAEAEINLGAVRSRDDQVALQIDEKSTFSGAEVSALLPKTLDREQIAADTVREILRPLIIDSRAALEFLRDHSIPADILSIQETRVRKLRTDHSFRKRLEATGELLPPSEAELRDLYDANKDELIQDREFLVESIIVRIGPASVVEDTAALESLHEMLSGDMSLDFIATAREHLPPSVLERSQVTAPTWRTKLGMRSGGKATVEALEKLELGEISPVFRTSFGNPTLRMMRLHEVREPRTLTFEESRAGLADFLVKRKLEERRTDIEQALLEEMDYRLLD